MASSLIGVVSKQDGHCEGNIRSCSKSGIHERASDGLVELRAIVMECGFGCGFCYFVEFGVWIEWRRGRLCTHLEPLENKFEICWLTEAIRTVGMPSDVYTEELSCGTEVWDLVLLHESGFDVVDGISWIEDLHVTAIEEVYAATSVDALFDVQIRVSQGLREA